MPELSFTPGDSMFVAHQCVVKTTGSGEPAVPTATLDMYNVNTNQHLQGIRNRIRNNPDFGLPFFIRSIDPNALKDIATDTVLQDLADLIFFQSFDVSQPTPSAAAVPQSRGGSAPERTLLGVVVQFTQENPMPALMIASAAGMLVGFFLGSANRR
jgi:hypothetical protein